VTHVELARTSPHSIEAERAALGSVFIKPIAFEDLSELSADDFFLPAHREILDAMRTIAARGREPSDVIMVAEELKASGMLARLDGGQSYLNELANGTPTAENVRHYAKIVRDKATLRRMIATARRSSSRRTASAMTSAMSATSWPMPAAARRDRDLRADKPRR
jgi:replicative DNA helicase